MDRPPFRTAPRRPCSRADPPRRHGGPGEQWVGLTTRLITVTPWPQGRNRPTTRYAAAMATELARLGVRARAAVKSISTASSAARDQALYVAADLLQANSAALLGANRSDLERARAEGLGDAALD